MVRYYNIHKDHSPLHNWNRSLAACSLQSRRILERDPWIVFRDDVVPPSCTLILPESWDESKSVFKGEVDGFKIGEGGFLLSPSRPSPLPPPLPLSLFRCFSRWRPRSMYLRVFVKKRLLCRLGSLGSAKHAKITINNFIIVYNPKYTRDHYHHHYY